MINRLWIILIAFSVLTNTSYSQLFNDSLFRQKIYYEDKQLSQFFDRFNFDEAVLPPDNSKPSRLINLLSIINSKDTALTSDSATVQFIKFVLEENNHIRLSLFDTNFFAISNCRFVYHEKIIPVEIILKPEGSSTSGYEWVICGIKGDIFNLKETKKVDTISINPMNHEVGFTELSKALGKKKQIAAYTSTSFQYNSLDAFLVMVQNGDLKYKQIDNVEYLFFQLPGWTFKVENFNRHDFNSGWLISKVIRMDTLEKLSYLRKNIL